MSRYGISVYALAVFALPFGLAAQGVGGMTMDDPPGAAAHEAMAGTMMEGAHMRMSPMRPMTTADSVRAMAIADTLRRALAKYADPASAERDGFKLFAPKVKNQKVYHYTNSKYALISAFRFDAAKPTSVLYKKNAAGQMQLVGAMYTMPRRASLDALDKRVPLSVTQWHLHTNLCTPKKGDERRYTELQNGKPLFGLNGSIATQAACDAENGNFTPVIFGWMVHANVFEGTDLKSVWGHDEH
jgi:hypothetical protein